MIRSLRVIPAAWFCLALGAFAPTAGAGIEPTPFLDFNFIPDAGIEARFEVVIPAGVTQVNAGDALSVRPFAGQAIWL